MNWLKRFGLVVTAAVILAMPMAAGACPACREAVAAGSSNEDEDYVNAPAAYNQSIYLMVGAPYMSLGVVTFLIYRGCRKNAAYLESMEQDSDSQLI